MVAPAYNPSYSGGRNGEDQDCRPAWGKSLGFYLGKNLKQKELEVWFKWQTLSVLIR
jgi:hypothetical protein